VHVRDARPADTEELVRLRAVMFEAMGVADDGRWQAPCAELLRDGLGGASLLGAVVDDPDGEGRLAACGIAVVSDRLPGPGDTAGLRAYIQSVVTDVGHRRCGLARAVMTSLIDRLASRGVTSVDLHTTDDGDALYRSLGFGDPRNPELQYRAEPTGRPGGAVS
jgi:ribosomal protein S18 acetylase RimI-like enzyme